MVFSHVILMCHYTLFDLLWGFRWARNSIYAKLNICFEFWSPLGPLCIFFLLCFRSYLVNIMNTSFRYHVCLTLLITLIIKGLYKPQFHSFVLMNIGISWYIDGLWKL
jgi:hypothetical protein